MVVVRASDAVCRFVGNTGQDRGQKVDAVGGGGRGDLGAGEGQQQGEEEQLSTHRYLEIIWEYSITDTGYYQRF